MTTERPEKTLADYLVIAICPVLIMALTGSVAFYLLDLGYHGQWAGRLRWTLFWFVIATVLVSRISIEQGRDHGRIYGICLALATAGLIYRLMGVAVVGWCLLALVWWCISKLTWDCTLVDDSEDASGEGLLQIAGVDSATNKAGGRQAAARPDEQKKTQRRSWWARLTGNGRERDGRPHAPGSWVIYFSAISLPAFGIGQAFFGSADDTQQQYSFRLLEIFVAAALGLLSATSFLGLRRYLRQRNLRMPSSIAGIWIVLGALLAGGIMAFCFLLPRPTSSYRSGPPAATPNDSTRHASRFAVISGEAAQGEGRQIGTGDSPTGDQSKDGTKGAGGQAGENKQSGADSSGQSQEKGQKGEVARHGDQGKSTKSETAGKEGDRSNPSPSKSVPNDWATSLMKWLLYGLVGAVVAYLLYRHRREVVIKLNEMWAALCDMAAVLFGWLRKRPQGQEIAPKTSDETGARGFESFENPFSTGTAPKMHAEELVTYTFAALQAWAQGRGQGRLPDQTPLEFARNLGAEASSMRDQLTTVGRLYTKVAYAGYRPNLDDMASLAAFWTALEQSDAVPSVAAG